METPVTHKYQKALAPDDQYGRAMVKDLRERYHVYTRDAVLGITNNNNNME